MRWTTSLAASLMMTLAFTVATASAADGLLVHTVKSIDGQDVNLAETYKGKVLLVVNVASKCGLTPQYKELEALNKKYADKGLVILGFPANNFGRQEPGTDTEIKEFCTAKYGVSFPMFSKISVKGADQHPLYKGLAAAAGGADPEWNFAKYLVAKDGQTVTKFPSRTKPDAKDLIAAIEKALSDQ